MHLTRKAASIMLPLAKKGNKYLVRSSSHVNNSVPILIAVRDMLNLALTSREVKHMIHNKLLKINGKTVTDFKQSIQLFHIFQADKTYMLSILPTGKFNLVETKDSTRKAKIISRKLVNGSKIQLNLHDGTNLIGKDNMKVGDTLVLDFTNKVKSHIAMEKGASVFMIGGSYAGQSGKIEAIVGDKAKVKIDKEESVLPLKNIFVQ